jgi:photosystem II stability/assembly factor-like uncharacterized protein
LLIKRFKANRKKVIKATLLLSFFGIFGIGGVLAASNITLNAASPITLGAGYTTATTCDDAVTLNTQTTLDPISGQFYVATIALSDISQNATTGCGNKTMELALKINGQMTYASWDIPAANADSTFIFSSVTSSLSDYYAMSALTPFKVDGLSNIAITKIGSFNLTYNWIGQDTARGWRSISSSSDGTKLAAAVNGGYIYTSSDSGATWTQRALSKNWRSITSSSDGTKLAAAPYNGGYIYTSNDSGVNWTQQTASGIQDWTSITSSADGSKLAATRWGSNVYTSSDSGVTWTARTVSGFISGRSITSSSDGTKLAVVGQSSMIYTSSDSGVTWTSRDSARLWYSITSSSDGSRLAAVVDSGYIYTSSDSGVTWTQRDTARKWATITSSSDGIKLAAAASPGYISISSDSGVTWTQSTAIGSSYWASIAASSDWSKLVAVGDSTPIYIGSAGSKTRSSN